MFADSLLDSPWADRSRRGWTTLVSFALQAVAVGGLLLLPLLYTQDLPQFQLISALMAPTPPPAPAPGPARKAHQTSSNMSSEGKMVAPRFVPREILQVDEPNAPPPIDLGGLRVPGGTGDSTAPNAVLDSVGKGNQDYCSASTGPIHASAARFPHDGRESHLSGAAGISDVGAAGADSGSRGVARDDQSGGQD